MRAVILAGGRGTRLEPVTHGAIPKPMAELAGRPVLEHIVRLLARNGFTQLCCTLACMPEKIRDYFGDGSAFGVHMEYRVEDKPLGTAGAVKNCRDFYQGRSFLVISGDAVCDFDLRALFEAHRRLDGAVTMALCAHEAPVSYGLVVTDARGAARSFIEKPPWEKVATDLVNTGIYAVSPRAMELVPEGVPYDFARDLFPRLLAREEGLFGLPMEGYWRDIGDPRSYYQANLDAMDGRLRLEAAPPARPAPEEEPREREAGLYACRSIYRTARRARLMRALAGNLMEAGADFSDGLRLDAAPGGVHIAPCPNREALVIESDSAETVQQFQDLVRRLDRES